jgi:cell division protein FtsW
MMVSMVRTRTRPPQAQFDELLLWVLAGLLALGLVMVYSASIATAEGSKFTGYQPAYYLMRHGIFIAVGIAAGAFAFSVPVQMWQSYAPALFVAGVLLLILVLVPGIGKSVNGSQRWLSLFVINLQPSELMKLFVVMYATSYVVRKVKVKDTFVKAYVPMFAVMVAW